MSEKNKGSSLWSSKPEDWVQPNIGTKEEIEKAIGEIDWIEFHGCETGDCDHEKQTECNAELLKVYKESRKELKDQNAELILALKFYADKESWFLDHCHETKFEQDYAGTIIYEDIENHEVGGKLARSVLKALGL